MNDIRASGSQFFVPLLVFPVLGRRLGTNCWGLNFVVIKTPAGFRHGRDPVLLPAGESHLGGTIWSIPAAETIVVHHFPTIAS